MDTALLVKAFGGFFAILNPFVALPVFLTLTSDYSEQRQRRTALRVALYAVVMGGVIMLGGQAILGFFGISVDHFRVAGGIVLMMIALGMLNGGSAAHTGTAAEKEHQTRQAETADVAFYPLTFPMLLGPGTITAIIVFTSQATDLPARFAVAGALIAVICLLLTVLLLAPTIGHHLSRTLQIIMTRLMGMILAAIAVEMVVVGLQHLLPALQA